MIYPNYCVQEMQECLDTYLTFAEDVIPPTFKDNGITKISSDYNVDVFLKLYDAKNWQL